jgi:hypothetical protein
MPPPTTQPPLFKHLSEIVDGTRAKPTTAARRHHYVPSFLLARWANPLKRDGVLFSLDIASNKATQTTPDRSAFARDLYAQPGPLDAADDPNLVFEAFLSIVEGYAADPLKALAKAPSTLDDQDRATLAYFIALQQGRTPPGLAQHRMNAQAAADAVTGAALLDRDKFARHFRERLSAEATDQELEAVRRQQLEAFEQGRLRPSMGPQVALAALLGVVADIAGVVASMQWTVLQASGAEFVACDRGMAMFDPTPRYPWTGNAWQSSANAEATVPLGPGACLLIAPGEEGYTVDQADAARVQAVNLRTYGWAEDSIFGASEQTVMDVSAAAKSFPDAVPKPRLPRQVWVEIADENDPSAGQANAERGWPRGVWIPDGAGGRRFMTYTVGEEWRPGAPTPGRPSPAMLQAMRTAFESR